MQRVNAEEVLANLAKIRAGMPLHRIRRPATPKPTRTRLDARTLDVQSVEEFELEAIADALETMADDARALAAASYQSALEMALDVFYAAEELARDPAHPDLVALVENMRRVYQSEYGTAIPTKAETERRRAEEAADAESFGVSKSTTT